MTNGYDASLIDHWENGIPYTADGSQLFSALHIVAAEGAGMDDLLNLMANDICPVCGLEDCIHYQKDKEFKKLRSAYLSGDLAGVSRIYRIRYSGMHQYDAAKKTALEKIKKEKEAEAVATAVKFTADFYKELLTVYGTKAEQLAKSLAAQAKGKKIRSAADAAKTWDKHQQNVTRKINAQDRAAIAKWLESRDVNLVAKNLKLFSKAFGAVGPAMDGYDLFFKELPKAIRSDNWRPFWVKAETIAAGLAATALTAFTFAVLAGNPVGLVGLALIMATVSALVDESVMEGFNQLIGI